MKKYIFNYILFLFILFYCYSVVAQNNTITNKIDYLHTIYLKKRQFIPDVLKGRANFYLEPGHYIIQFHEVPTVKEINHLSSKQINILEWIPANAVMAYVPGNINLIGFPEIRWVGKLRPTDKISDKLDESLRKGFALVNVFPDVEDNYARELISDSDSEIIENRYLAPGTFLVRADTDIVEELSRAEGISWIWPASDDLINGGPVYFCPGPRTVLGFVPSYVKFGEGWDGPGRGSIDLSFYFANGTPDVPGFLEEAEVENAFHEWSKYAAITWAEASVPNLYKSIDILWAIADHGDTFPFDGPGKVIAHSFFPAPPNPEPIAGDLHFDEAETWNIGSNIDIFSVALHEGGHSLGLDHSDNTNAVMYPYYKMVTGLNMDDINGIRSLYANCADGNDSDYDGVCDDGDQSGVIGDNPCVDGQTLNCDDNCIGMSNASQTDFDSDLLGNACDNCIDIPNSPNKGTCISGANTGDICTDNATCGAGGFCGMNQEDSDDDSIGDVCDQCPFDAENDADNDGFCEDEDNCPNIPNGTISGTCVKFILGVFIGSDVSCTGFSDCGEGETCQMEQTDINANGIGDACECYADFDNSTQVNMFDLIIIKNEYNRSDCDVNPCDADCNDDDKVNLFDLIIMKNQYNRSGCPVL